MSYETLARERKAYVLADILQRAGVDAECLLSMPPAVWRLAVAVAENETGRNMTPPSSATQTLVLDILRRRWVGEDELARRRARDAAVAADPFIGLPS